MNTSSKHSRVHLDDKTYTVLSVRNGGMGRVWLLEQSFVEPQDPVYKRKLAVKTFDFRSDEASVERELNIWISLSHRSILPLLSIGRLNFRLAAIMPLLNGSLDDLIQEKGALPEPLVVKMLAQIVDALEYCWASFQLLHLDLKPSNVLLDFYSDGGVKVADWGISRIAKESRLDRKPNLPGAQRAAGQHLTMYGAGTPLFMAPERIVGPWAFSPRADIYSLGMMAVQLSTGVLPFRLGASDPIEEIVSGAYMRNVNDVLANHSMQFRDFCLSCLHPDLSKRPGTFLELSDRLSAIAKGRG